MWNWPGAIVKSVVPSARGVASSVSPRVLPGNIVERPKHVSPGSGANHALALTSTGNLYLWGYNTNGQIGDGTTTTRSTAVQSSLANVTAIAAGVELIRSRGRFSYATCDTVRRSYSAGLI